VTSSSERFDAILLSRARLGVIAVLMTRGETAFSDLKSLLGLTQGNLGIHLRKLEEGGYIRIKKEFVQNKPRTSCRITARGRTAFLAHVEQLERIARGEDPA
jgi:DNA-binding MarR family transcriptional regulator